MAFAALAAMAALPWQWVGTVPKIDALDLHDYKTPAPVVRCLADFIFGLIAYKIYARSPGAIPFVGRGSFGLVVIGAILLGMFYGLDLLVVPLFFLLILHLSSDRGPVASALQWTPVYNLGLWSYAIYLVHYRTEAIWYYLTAKLEGPLHGWGHVAATTILFVCAIAVAIPVHHFFEKPVQRFLRRHYDGLRKPDERQGYEVA